MLFFVASMSTTGALVKYLLDPLQASTKKIHHFSMDWLLFELNTKFANLIVLLLLLLEISVKTGADGWSSKLCFALDDTFCRVCLNVFVSTLDFPLTLLIFLLE